GPRPRPPPSSLRFADRTLADAACRPTPTLPPRAPLRPRPPYGSLRRRPEWPAHARAPRAAGRVRRVSGRTLITSDSRAWQRTRSRQTAQGARVEPAACGRSAAMLNWPLLRGTVMIANVLIALVALIHVYIVALEMFLWDTPRGRAVFGTTAEFSAASRVLAANQGLYNGFLVAGLAWGLWLGEAGFAVKVFFLACVLVAGLYGAATAS